MILTLSSDHKAHNCQMRSHSPSSENHFANCVNCRTSVSKPQIRYVRDFSRSGPVRSYFRLISTASTANRRTWMVAPEAYLPTHQYSYRLKSQFTQSCSVARTRMARKSHTCRQHSTIATEMLPTSTLQQLCKQSIQTELIGQHQQNVR